MGISGKSKVLILALKPLEIGDGSPFVESLPSGYALYLEDTKTVADWIDLQVLLSQEDRLSLDAETQDRLRETGTAVFRTVEQARNMLCALEKSV
jgi:myo-inositol-1-phosphate synthase